MKVESLKTLYSEITDCLSAVFVVPLIRHAYPSTDYLYLLYQHLIEDEPDIEVRSLSAADHYKFVLSALFRRSVILHYHWLEFQDLRSLIGMPYKLLCIWTYCLFGGRLVWTVHNLKPHDKNYLEMHRRIHRWMARKAALVHVHSETAARLAAEYMEIDEGKVRVLPHPEFPSKIIPAAEAREKIQQWYGYHDRPITSPVFLVFGGISEYKGIRTLISIMTEFQEDFTFIIAGYVKKGQDSLHRYIVQSTVDDQRFIYTNGFVPEERYPYLLSAADICPFNYDGILTSGGVAMARAYEREVIAPRLGGLVEYEQDEKVHLFDTIDELTLLIKSRLQNG